MAARQDGSPRRQPMTKTGVFDLVKLLPSPPCAAADVRAVPNHLRSLSPALRAIEELTQQKRSLALRVEELEAKLHDKSSSLKQKEAEAEVCLPRLFPLHFLSAASSLLLTHLNTQTQSSLLGSACLPCGVNAPSRQCSVCGCKL